jgi:hypothetical protein
VTNNKEIVGIRVASSFMTLSSNVKFHSKIEQANSTREPTKKKITKIKFSNVEGQLHSELANANGEIFSSTFFGIVGEKRTY